MVKKDKEAVERVPANPNAPRAKLSPTSNPKVFLDKAKGELYYLHETPFLICLRKLNEGV